MTSLRAKVTGLSVAIFIGGIGLLLLSGAFLLEPWFTVNTRRDFEQIRKDMGAVRQEQPGGLTRRAQDLAKGTGYKIEVVDARGEVFASSAPEFRPGDTFPLPREENDFLAAHLEGLGRGEASFGILRASPPGQSAIHLVAAFRPGCFLVVSQPLEQLRKPISMASGFFVTAGAFILLLEFAAFLMLSGSIVRPIRRLTGVAQRIAGGEYGARCDARNGGGRALRTDEFDLLGQSIDEMASRLAGDIEELAAMNARLAGKVQAQEDFLAGASHELKTPVGLVRGYAEALKLGYWSGEKERDELADIILKEADHLDRLVRDLSFAAMGDSAGRALMLEEGDLAILAREAAERFSREAASRGLGIMVEAKDAAPSEFDAGRVRQALDNLLSNAIRHTEGGDRIKIQVVDGGSQWRLEVMNPGCPIPEDQLDRLFEPFYRVDASRNRGSGGSGLGLAAVRRIAESHGGSCGIENAGNGVKAWIALPKRIRRNAADVPA